MKQEKNLIWLIFNSAHMSQSGIQYFKQLTWKC